MQALHAWQNVSTVLKQLQGCKEPQSAPVGHNGSDTRSVRCLRASTCSNPAVQRARMLACHVRTAWLALSGKDKYPLMAEPPSPIIEKPTFRDAGFRLISP